MRLLSEIDVSGRRVFVRADLDVPTRETRNWGVERGNGSEDLEAATRLTNLKPTIDWLIRHGASQIIISGHIDRPSVACAMEGKPPFYDQELSTKQLLEALQKILGRDIEFTQDVIAICQLAEKQSRDRHAKADLARDDNKKVFLLENLRFWPGRGGKDLELARSLAPLADV